MFDPTNALIADSRSLLEAGREVQFALLPPVEPLSPLERAYERAIEVWRQATGGPRLPVYVERGTQTATDYQEVVGALSGNVGAAQRVRDGEVVLSVALPSPVVQARPRRADADGRHGRHRYQRARLSTRDPPDLGCRIRHYGDAVALSRAHYCAPGDTPRGGR